MPKLKSSRGAAKRMKVTGTGKILRKKAGKSHLLINKNARRRRSLRASGLVNKSYEKVVKRLLPYSF